VNGMAHNQEQPAYFELETALRRIAELPMPDGPNYGDSIAREAILTARRALKQLHANLKDDTAA
jgi:hypothetical protein